MNQVVTPGACVAASSEGNQIEGVDQVKIDVTVKEGSKDDSDQTLILDGGHRHP
jgi:hypothetical protein